MGRWASALLAALLLAGCAAETDARTTTAPTAAMRPDASFLLVNLAGGYADGAERRGRDDVVGALVERVRTLPAPPAAVFLNEACESHAELRIDDRGFVPWWQEEVPLFNVMAARLVDAVRHAGHAGHADILRESLDRAVGEHAAQSLPLHGRGTAYWEERHARIERAARAADPAGP